MSFLHIGIFVKCCTLQHRSNVLRKLAVSDPSHVNVLTRSEPCYGDVPGSKPNWLASNFSGVHPAKFQQMPGIGAQSCSLSRVLVSKNTHGRSPSIICSLGHALAQQIEGEGT